MADENTQIVQPSVWHLLLTGFAMAAGAYLFEVLIRRKIEG